MEFEFNHSHFEGCSLIWQQCVLCWPCNKMCFTMYMYKNFTILVSLILFTQSCEHINLHDFDTVPCVCRRNQAHAAAAVAAAAGFRGRVLKWGCLIFRSASSVSDSRHL